MRPCGPTIDVAAAERAREAVFASAAEADVLEPLREAWPLLEPVFAASPYLARRGAMRVRALAEILGASPETRVAAVLAETRALAQGEGNLEEVGSALRR
jgi:hypothetical protein